MLACNRVCGGSLVRCKEGLSLYSKKPDLKGQSINFFGATYSADDMLPDPKKIQCIKEF